NINYSGNATHVDQNTQLDHNVGGSTTCAFAGQGTKGPSDVQTCIPTMENMRPISYINVVPMEPSTILTSANDVTKGPGLNVNIKGHVSFSKLVNGEQSKKSANFHTLLWPAHNGANVAVSLDSVRVKKHGGRSSFARAMIELRADVELKDTIIVYVPKLVGEGFSMYMMYGYRKDFYMKFYNSLGSVPNRCSVV
ncbi:hypothetical protein Tco_0886016, partial [Tanacetum coccineum]